MTITNLTSENFEQFITESEVPVLVDFWAEWCGPCKMMLPVLEQLAEELDGKVVIAKVDVDTETPLRGGIVSIPTMRVYNFGQSRKEIIGAKPKAALLKELEEYL